MKKNLFWGMKLSSILCFTSILTAGCTSGLQSAQSAQAGSIPNSLLAQLQSGAAYLKTATSAQALAAGACSSAVQIELVDTSGQMDTFTGSVGIPLSASPADLTFYSDSHCSTPITMFTLNGKSASGQFYFKASTAGSSTISVNLLNLVSTSQTENITDPAATAYCQSGTYSEVADGNAGTMTLTVSSSGSLTGSVTSVYGTFPIAGTCANGSINFDLGPSGSATPYVGTYSSSGAMNGTFVYAGATYAWSAGLSGSSTAASSPSPAPAPAPAPSPSPSPAPLVSGTCSYGTAYVDGCPKAPNAAPQYPKLLASYVSRPAWNVAGVDYAVGFPSGTVLKDPSTINIPGVQIDPTNHIVNVNGNNIRLSGYDFSLNGGWQVVVNSGSNNVVENNNFAMGSNAMTSLSIESQASDTLVQYNMFNSNGLGSFASGQMMIASNGVGTTTFQYNLIENAWGECIVASSDVGGENFVLRYNVIANAGLGSNQGAHGDWIQLYNSPNMNTNSVDISFNTVMQTVPIATGRTQGLSLFSANSGPTSGGVQTESVQNNVFIVPSGAYVNYAIIMDTSRLIGSGTIMNNYLDTTGVGTAPYGGYWYFAGNYNDQYGGPYNGPVSLSGNLNMVTGAPLN